MGKEETQDPKAPQWKRMSFKGNKVWVETRADGSLLETDNKVRIKYNLMQDHEYRVNKESLAPEEAALPAGAPERENQKPKSRKKKQPATDIFKGLPPNCIKIFTDGAASGNPGPAGIGVLLQYGEHEKRISKPIGAATNNIAELRAIEEGLLALKRRDLPVRVFTDSAYAMDVISGKKKATANREIVQRLQQLKSGFVDVELIKVKGHAGIKENEVADYLAVSAAEKSK